jgi:hypothetical protein
VRPRKVEKDYLVVAEHDLAGVRLMIAIQWGDIEATRGNRSDGHDETLLKRTLRGSLGIVMEDQRRQRLLDHIYAEFLSRARMEGWTRKRLMREIDRLCWLRTTRTART